MAPGDFGPRSHQILSVQRASGDLGVSLSDDAEPSTSLSSPTAKVQT